MPITAWQEQMGVREFQFSWWTLLNLTWFWCYCKWDIFDAAQSLLKCCRRWSRASFAGDNNRMRLFRLKWVNIWKIPLLIIRPCLREADWCCLYQMVCSMRLSPSAPVNTPDGETAWGETWGCSQRIHVGTKSPHWEKHSQGFQLKVEEEKVPLRKMQNDTDLSSGRAFELLSVVTLNGGPVPSWCQAWGCLTCFSRAVSSCWHQKHEALAVLCWHLSYKIGSNNEW